jgi:hypothetical protein
MAFSHSITYGVSVNSGTPSSFNSSQTFDGQVSIQVTVPASSSNFSIVCPVDSALVKSVVMWADGPCTVVAKDSGGSTVDTFNMTANKPLLWQYGFPTSSPITGDYATLEVTCTPEVVLTGYFGEDV